jgi:ribosomal-protein-alanine N-acetyltransferase
MNETIILEKFKLQDFELFFELMHDERITALLTTPSASLENSKRDFEEQIENSHQHPSFGLFKIFEKEKKQFIGAGKLTIENRNRKEAELGYMLLPHFWGNGYGNEITEVLLAKARKESTLKKVTAVIHPANVASRKILKRNGFKLIENPKQEMISAEFYELDIIHSNSK